MLMFIATWYSAEICGWCHQMSLLKTGLLQLSPESVVVGDVTYYDRGPAVIDRVDRESIAEVLGLTSKVIIGSYYYLWM